MKKSDAESLKISNYNYSLPDERIAKYPLKKRNSSKLLLYKNKEISTYSFNDIAQLVPEDSLIVFNDTRVIHARLFFRKATGAVIEIFCLSPNKPEDYQINFQQRERVVWNCMIGNAKKWKDDSLHLEINIDGVAVTINASKLSKTDTDTQVEFTWNDNRFTFSDLLEVAGKLPIPPYLNRESEVEDDETYQTVYSKIEGSVAAPTAGLHFTPEVMSLLSDRGIKTNYVTLHVGAGTFKPVKSETMLGHHMHAEFIAVNRSLIEALIANIGNIVVVGTTSMRTIESLYYIGKQIVLKPDTSESRFFVSQWEPYDDAVSDISELEALKAILRYMDENELDLVYAETEIIIVPGYKFHYPRAIVTNFHQPQSTLLLLISAFIGEEWRNVYDYAMKNDYRFLSYGDSSLLFAEQ